MIEQQNAVVKWISGKKTYADAIAILICGILAWKGVKIPVFVWAALGALGLGFLRAGVKKGEIGSR